MTREEAIIAIRGFMGQLTEDCQEALISAIPELAESEDEMIRKELIEYLTHRAEVTGFTDEDKDCKRWIAYLKKQKENHLGKYSEEDNLKYRLNWVMKDYYRAGKEGDEREHRFKCYQLFWDALEDETFFEQKEQKPIKVLYIPKFRTGDLVRSSKNPRLTYKILSVGSMNELGNPEYEVEIFTDGKPDEPRNLKHIEIEKMDSWGELVKQKPAEWSEDDERIAKEIEEELWYPGDFPDYPSKEESELYDDCQRRLDWFKNKLKSLRPRSHWKPSEEQMKALDNARFCKAYDRTELDSLYEQLKKLM